MCIVIIIIIIIVVFLFCYNADFLWRPNIGVLMGFQCTMNICNLWINICCWNQDTRNVTRWSCSGYSRCALSTAPTSTPSKLFRVDKRRLETVVMVFNEFFCDIVIAWIIVVYSIYNERLLQCITIFIIYFAFNCNIVIVHKIWVQFSQNFIIVVLNFLYIKKTEN